MIIQKLKEQGGIKLLILYLKSGVLLYAFLQILLTGKSKKSLEIVRLGVQLKIRNKLYKKYKNVLCKQYEKTTKISTPSNKVWVCWLQGIENAPDIVQTCYKSLKTNLSNKEVILITETNRKRYITLPDCIEEKYAKGIITHTHFSDILRVALLSNYGGTWIDATVYCSGKNIPLYMLDSDFFVFQNLKPGADGHVLNISSWFMTAQKGNILITSIEKLLYAYWKNHNYLIDYFLLHHFFSIASEVYPDEWKKIIKYPNSLPHILLLNFFEPFNHNHYQELIKICPFHKLSYKHKQEIHDIKGTYYEHILNLNK